MHTAKQYIGGERLRRVSGTARLGKTVNPAIREVAAKPPTSGRVQPA